jgi:hypothetical protein
MLSDGLRVFAIAGVGIVHISYRGPVGLDIFRGQQSNEKGKK